MSIDKSICSYLYKFTNGKGYHYKDYNDDNEIDNLTLSIRQDILKAVYQIELTFLKELILDTFEKYDIANFYAYNFYTDISYVYITKNKKVYDANKEIVNKAILNVDDKDIKFKDITFLYFFFIPFIRNINDIHSSLIDGYKLDKKNKDINYFCNHYILSFIELCNKKDNDKVLIIPNIHNTNIFQKLKIEYLLRNDSLYFVDELNFYTDNSFVKLYEYNYKNDKDLYIVDSFNESIY